MDYTIRKAREADILAIAGIYDRILTKEEAGRRDDRLGARRVSDGKLARTRRWRRGIFSCWKTGVKSARRRASIRCRYRNTETPTGAMQTCRKTRLWCCTRWWSTPRCAGGMATERHLSRFMSSTQRSTAAAYLRMDTNVINKAARRFYAKLGFWESGDRRLRVQRHSGCEAGVPGERSWIFEPESLIFAA